MKSLSDLRKALKPLGFRVKTAGLSWGRHATYGHTASGDWLTYNVFSQEQAERWAPLFNFIREHRDAIKAVAEAEDLKGLRWATT